MTALPLPLAGDRRHARPASWTDQAIAVGVDVGGTKIAAGLVAEDGTLAELHRVETPSCPDELLDAIVQMVRQIEPAGSTLPIGCGYPGMVTLDGSISAGPNIALTNMPLARELSNRLGVPVVVENDAAAATWAEFRLGAGRITSRAMAMVTLGTGVGGGLVLDGRLFRGSNGFAAELGHLILRARGRVGPSGIAGEVEAYCSGTALLSLAVEAVAEGRAPADSVLRDVRHLSSRVIAEAARNGDPLAVELVDSLAQDLGIALGSIVNMLDVDVIVLGGGLGEATDLLIDRAQRSMDGVILGAGRRPFVPIVPAALGNRAGIVGAALLADVHR